MNVYEMRYFSMQKRGNDFCFIIKFADNSALFIQYVEAMYNILLN